MNWILGVTKNVLPIIAPLAPAEYPKLIPKNLVRRLGEFDVERWTKVLRRHRVDLVINEHKCNAVVVGEYDHEQQYMMLQITNTKSKKLVFELIQTILHEMVHVNQFAVNGTKYYRRTGNETSNSFTNYLMLNGELEAFAHCLFVEMQDQTDIKKCPTRLLYKRVSVEGRMKLMYYFKKHKAAYEAAGVKLNNEICEW